LVLIYLNVIGVTITLRLGPLADLVDPPFRLGRIGLDLLSMIIK